MAWFNYGHSLEIQLKPLWTVQKKRVCFLQILMGVSKMAGQISNVPKPKIWIKCPFNTSENVQSKNVNTFLAAQCALFGQDSPWVYIKMVFFQIQNLNLWIDAQLKSPLWSPNQTEWPFGFEYHWMKSMKREPIYCTCKCLSHYWKSPFLPKHLNQEIRNWVFWSDILVDMCSWTDCSSPKLFGFSTFFLSTAPPGWFTQRGSLKVALSRTEFLMRPEFIWMLNQHC